MTGNVMSCKDESTNGASAPERIEAGLSYTPRVDIFEAEEEIAIYADMPGCKPDEIDVKFERGQLEIFGKCPPRHENVAYLLQEYGVGNYYRTFTISEAIDVDRINASYSRGVATIRLPKSAAAKPKRIEVTEE